MTHRRRVLFALLLLVCSAEAAAPTARADRVDDLVRREMRRRHIPGLALAVVRDGKIIKARGYGLASVEFDAPATPETVFEIGSITKQFTATAVVMLVEEGRLALDDPLSKHLPHTPEAWRGVTVRHLLTHTSGLRNYTGLPGFELTERLGRDDFIKLIAQHPPAFRPGESWSYGNTNYNLLGFIVEAASGKPYWQFVSERIFRPLGMTATSNRDPRFVVRRRATGYEWEGGELTGRDYDLTDVFAAGALLSTVLDLAKWDAALYTERLVKRASLEEMWTPVRLASGETRPYGLGWNIEEFRGRRRLRHNGQTAGFAANITRYTDDRLTFIVLCNLGRIGLAGEVATSVAKLYLPALSLRRMKEQPDPDPLASQRLRTALSDLLAGKADAAAFTPEAHARLTNEEARARWRETAAAGPLSSFAFVGEERRAGGRVARYVATTGRQMLLLRFTLAGEGKITELSVEEEE
jgi:D-alanyl-D-alanine carboxypeptidase